MQSHGTRARAIRPASVVRVLALVVAGLAILGLALFLAPLDPPRFAHAPHPAASYQDALADFAALGNDDSCEISPECHTQILTHGAKAARVVVLLHGFTNCPAQFVSLGQQLFDRGANVVIPTLPRHGCADRMTTALSRLDAAECAAFTDRVLDDAQALGDSVTVVGLSTGAVLAAWGGTWRADVDRVVAIAPLLGPPRVHPFFAPAVARAFRAMGNRYTWWDDRERERLEGPRHVYPRWASRAVGEVLWLGGAVRREARHARPAAHTLVMVTVGGDRAVSNDVNAEVARDWRAHGAEVIDYQFPAELDLPHDLIDPEQVGANPQLVYPNLVRLILPGN